jgi:hypothetical protein
MKFPACMSPDTESARQRPPHQPGLRSPARTEDLQLQGDAGEECQDDAGGDEMDAGLHRGAADEADAVEKRAQIAHIHRCLATIEPDIGERALGPFLGGAGHERLELGIGHADMTLSGAARAHTETIPTSVGRVRLVQGLASTGFAGQLE